jgi:hypothetical protein
MHTHSCAHRRVCTRAHSRTHTHKISFWMDLNYFTFLLKDFYSCSTPSDSTMATLWEQSIQCQRHLLTPQVERSTVATINPKTSPGWAFALSSMAASPTEPHHWQQKGFLLEAAHFHQHSGLRHKMLSATTWGGRDLGKRWSEEGNIWEAKGKCYLGRITGRLYHLYKIWTTVLIWGKTLTL